MELEEGVRYPILRLPNKLLFFCLFVCFLRYGFLCSLGCSEINFVNYADLELRSSCLYLISHTLGLKVCAFTTHPGKLLLTAGPSVQPQY